MKWIVPPTLDEGFGRHLASPSIDLSCRCFWRLLATDIEEISSRQMPDRDATRPLNIGILMLYAPRVDWIRLDDVCWLLSCMVAKLGNSRFSDNKIATAIVKEDCVVAPVDFDWLQKINTLSRQKFFLWVWRFLAPIPLGCWQGKIAGLFLQMREGLNFKDSVVSPPEGLRCLGCPCDFRKPKHGVGPGTSCVMSDDK